MKILEKRIVTEVMNWMTTESEENVDNSDKNP